MQIWAESGKSALPICNYSQILYQFLTFTQNLKRSQLQPFLQLPSRKAESSIQLFPADAAFFTVCKRFDFSFQ